MTPSFIISADQSCKLICLLEEFFQMLRSFPRFALHSSSANEDKIIIFDRFQCSLANIIQLNRHLVKLIGKIEICSIQANLCKLAPGSPRKTSKGRTF